jgi:hypothetical protein
MSIMVQIMDVTQLISKAGGPSVIAQRSAETGSPISVWAIQKWRARQSIPDEHWQLLSQLTGLSIAEIYAISAARRGSRAA